MLLHQPIHSDEHSHFCDTLYSFRKHHPLICIVLVGMKDGHLCFLLKNHLSLVHIICTCTSNCAVWQCSHVHIPVTSKTTQRWHWHWSIRENRWPGLVYTVRVKIMTRVFSLSIISTVLKSCNLKSHLNLYENKINLQFWLYIFKFSEMPSEPFQLYSFNLLLKKYTCSSYRKMK